MPALPNSTTDSAAPRLAVATSVGMRRIAGLHRFVDVDEVVSPRELRRRSAVPDCVLAWGRKRSAGSAVALATRLGVPLRWLEDGWIRTASRNAHSPFCYSLLVDQTGVYYDATAPSDIETFLADDTAVASECDATALERAAALRASLVAAEITKYNYCRSATPPTDPFVLVIDQTRDDASVLCGGMNAERFCAMLQAAVTENPLAKVIVRTHPDVVAGRRRGYLSEAASELGVSVVAGDDNPMTWLKAAKRVYVGTSQIGYEALLAECPVSIFGLPFYAGWGLADERQSHARRNVARRLDELVHAAHVKLARYVCPVTGESWTPEQCVAHVGRQKEMFRRNARDFRCTGIALWKRGYLSAFLKSPDGTVSFGSSYGSCSTDIQLTWGFRRFSDSKASAEAPLVRVEDGFLRSSGLGSDFTAPGSLVFDASGLYFDASMPSDLETLLASKDCTASEIARAMRLRALLLSQQITKYNLVTRESTAGAPTGKRLILVTGQVEDDESIKRGTAAVATNTALLQSVRKRCPDDWIVYRPHPDVQAGNRRGKVDDFTLHGCADVVDEGGSIIELIEAADEVHTMTSLSGFEALLRGRRVVTWGAPFYAGWGLTEDYGDLPRRGRKRSLDELIYLSLIAYPRYVDHATGEFISAETQAHLISLERQSRLGSRQGIRQGSRALDRVLNVIKGVRHAA